MEQQTEQQQPQQAGITPAGQTQPSTPATQPVNSQAQEPPHPITRKRYQPLAIPTPEQIIQQDIMDNCVVKSAISGIMGGMFGAVFGLFSASLDVQGGFDMAVPVEENKPTRVILKEGLLNAKNKMVSYAKGFAAMGALYSFNECVIEKARGKHDKWNPALAGCATGGMLAYQGICLGCASFAVFSTVIEYWMESHS